MNYLAHTYYSGNNPELMLGNFIADFVKGSRYNEYPAGVAEGILMHRRLDEFIDTHPLVGEVRKIYFEEYRHYAGIIIDMIFDHFLASQWPKLESISLSVYASNVYEILGSQQEKMPAKAQEVYRAMKKYNWLEHYASQNGVHEALTRMSKRHRFKQDLGNSKDLYQTHQPFIEETMLQFYHEALELSMEWKK